MNRPTLIARAYDPRELGAQCDRCPLSDRDPVPPAPARDGKPRLVIVGMNPGSLEENRGIPFIGPSGRMLDTCLSEAGFDREEAHITNAALCRSNDDQALKRAVPCCAPRLATELAPFEGVPILALGAEACRPLLGKAGIMKARGFVWTARPIEDASIRNCKRTLDTRIRLRKNEDKIEAARDSLALMTARKTFGGRTILPSVHPAMILRGADGWLPVLRLDIKRAVRWVQDGGIPLEDEVPFTQTSNPEVARRLLAKMGDHVNVDIETDGNEPMTVNMTCVGVADVGHIQRWVEGKIKHLDPRRIVILDPWSKRLVPVLKEALRDRTVLTHNGPAFDEPVLGRSGIRYKKRNDTLIAHYGYASDKPKSLAFVSSIYNVSTPWKTRFKQGDEEKGVAGFGVKKEDLAAYNAADIVLGSLSWIRMQPDLAPERRVYDHDMKHARLCQRMQQNGLLIDQARRKELSTHLRRRSAALLGAMRELLGRRKFHPRRPNDIRKALFEQLKTPLYLARSTPTGLAACNAELFERLKTGSNRAAKLARLIVDWRRANDIRAEYLDNLLLAADGRVHAHWRSYGTQCMPAGELVLTDRGYLAVEKVTIGDQVITHEGRPRKVTGLCQSGPERIFKVTLSNGLTLRTNGDHPYFTASRRWCAARWLTVGQSVVVHADREVWKAVAQWPYEVSSWGRVRGVKGGPLALQKKDVWGHLKVTLKRNGSRKRGVDIKDFTVHRLVLLAHGALEFGAEEVRHLDGIAWDNTVRNLAWGTCLENKADAVKHGRMSKRSRTAKLTQERVDRIRRESRDYFGDATLAKEFGVSRELVRDVRLGKRWLVEGQIEGNTATFFEVEVLSIEAQAPEITYGLTVEEDESHVTGGIVTHNTGRPATHKPNILNIPRIKFCRGCGEALIDGMTHKPTCNPKKRTEPQAEYQARDIYIAAPGHVFIYFDLSQAEMRFAANLSGDAAFIEACKGDVHAGNARVLFRSVPGALEALMDPKGKGKGFRDIAKNCGFAIVYLAEADKLFTHLLEHGFDVELDICQDAIDAIHTTYWRYFEYVDENILLCKKHGYLRTAFLGRKRWLGKLPKPTDVSNFPIQSGVADVMNDRLAIIDGRQAKGVKHVLYQYDSAIYEVPEDLAAQHEALIDEVWAEEIAIPGTGRSFKQPIDRKRGTRWSDFG